MKNGTCENFKVIEIGLYFKFLKHFSAHVRRPYWQFFLGVVKTSFWDVIIATITFIKKYF